MALVSVSVEDERAFSVLNFVCNTLRKCLTTHLEDVVRIKCEQEYNTSTFDTHVLGTYTKSCGGRHISVKRALENHVKCKVNQGQSQNQSRKWCNYMC